MNPRLSASSLALATLVAVTLSGCGGAGGADGDRATGPGGVSEGEARALEQAAKLLDEQRLPEGALPQTDPPAQPGEDARPGEDPAAAAEQQDNPQ